MNNKFYWIKLKTDFFRREEIDFLLSQTNGAEYVVLYQMLCLNTVNTSGKLETKIGEMIVPYNAKKIARDCKYFDIDTINVAMNLYKKLGLIYEEENKILKISEYDELVGAETTWAKKKRLYREKKNQKMIEYKDIGEDKHRDIEKDINVDMQVDNVLKKSENEDIEEDIVREENRDKRLEYKSIDNNSLFSFLEKEMNRTLNFLEVEKIENWLQSFDKEIIKAAIEIAKSKNKISLGYIDGILANWKNENKTNVNDIKSEFQEIPHFKEFTEEQKIILNYDWLNEEE